MNGIFTEAESAWLAVEERIHYLRLGLCAPVSEREIEGLAVQLGAADRIDELEDDVERLSGALSAEGSARDELLVNIDRCLMFVADPTGLTVEQVCARIREILE